MNSGTNPSTLLHVCCIQSGVGVIHTLALSATHILVMTLQFLRHVSRATYILHSTRMITSHQLIFVIELTSVISIIKFKIIGMQCLLDVSCDGIIHTFSQLHHIPLASHSHQHSWRMPCHHVADCVPVRFCGPIFSATQIPDLAMLRMVTLFHLKFVLI